jgi:hypothetical protein
MPPSRTRVLHQVKLPTPATSAREIEPDLRGVAVEALFDPRPQQSWFHVAYAESNVSEHECAIDQKATDD